MNKKTDTKLWILIIAAVFALSAAAAAVIFLLPKGNTVANIYVDGNCVRSLDLSTVGEAFEFSIETPYGNNTVRVEKGRIRVLEADCPDLTCVKTGWTEDSGAPIVCLPHRLVIKIEKAAGTDIDSVSR